MTRPGRGQDAASRGLARRLHAGHRTDLLLDESEISHWKLWIFGGGGWGRAAAEAYVVSEAELARATNAKTRRFAGFGWGGGGGVAARFFSVTKIMDTQINENGARLS
jgi:hypothetical protein